MSVAFYTYQEDANKNIVVGWIPRGYLIREVTGACGNLGTPFTLSHNNAPKVCPPLTKSSASNKLVQT